MNNPKLPNIRMVLLPTVHLLIYYCHNVSCCNPIEVDFSMIL